MFVLLIGVPLLLCALILVGTKTLPQFVWLFRQAAGLPVIVWPISLTLAICLFISYKTALNAGQLQSLRLLWVSPLVVLPFVMLVYGAVFEFPKGKNLADCYLLEIQLVLSLAIGVFAIAVNGGRRTFVAALTVMLWLCAVSCGATASMSVSGDWP